MNSNIEGKVVVITGASSGLGEATARHLSAGGAAVVLGARRTDRIQSLAEALNGNGGRALAVTTDVTVHEQVKALVDAAVELTAEDLRDIESAASQITVQGERYPESAQRMIDR